jgi:hypothetical protein
VGIVLWLLQDSLISVVLNFNNKFALQTVLRTFIFQTVFYVFSATIMYSMEVII